MLMSQEQGRPAANAGTAQSKDGFPGSLPVRGSVPFKVGGRTWRVRRVSGPDIAPDYATHIVTRPAAGMAGYVSDDGDGTASAYTARGMVTRRGLTVAAALREVAERAEDAR
jgi:hypothetical protein